MSLDSIPFLSAEEGQEQRVLSGNALCVDSGTLVSMHGTNAQVQQRQASRHTAKVDSRPQASVRVWDYVRVGCAWV